MVEIGSGGDWESGGLMLFVLIVVIVVDCC